MDKRAFNKGVTGNKGGSRKSAFEEYRDAEWMSDIWQAHTKMDELRAKIASGVYSGRDIVALKLLEGNERLMTKFMDKLVADKHEVTGANGAPLFLPSEILIKNGINHTDTSSEADSD